MSRQPSGAHADGVGACRRHGGRWCAGRAGEVCHTRLAAEGRTNPEIGSQLFMSPRTAEYHLRKVYAKLGVGSRHALRDALRTTAGTAERT
jgi:hypothetical protein